MKYTIELIMSVDIDNANNRQDAEDKALEHFMNNTEAYICHESITPEVPPTIDFTRINNDTNGNPRYVVHYLNFITDADRRPGYRSPDTFYDAALSRAKELGGRKFHNKQYGGGIVFQSYNTNQLQKEIFELVKQYE